uniref:Uncharacterized protein n=1 Tax=Romanomermis culicivorax TaxID=13658 RepID=A0A915IE87_ROMCU
MAPPALLDDPSIDSVEDDEVSPEWDKPKMLIMTVMTFSWTQTPLYCRSICGTRTKIVANLSTQFSSSTNLKVTGSNKARKWRKSSSFNEPMINSLLNSLSNGLKFKTELML